MKKFIITLLLAVTLLLSGMVFVACNKEETVEPVDPDDPPMELFVYHEPLTPDEARDYHVGFATLGMDRSEDEYRGVEGIFAKYGKAEEGGMGKWVVLPANFADEQELVISIIASLADDPKLKAIIVNPGVQGTAAGFQRIREMGRDDILLMANMPQDDPEVMSKVADLIIDSDNVMRGYYDILRAKEMGATTFVHMSFPRHMGVYVLARRKAIYEEACKDLGIEFLDETVPDPATGDLGAAGAQQAVNDMMPGLIKKYGKDAVFFTTNIALHEPIIKHVVELGALFVDTDDLSPVCGFPGALALDLTAQQDDWPAIVKKIEEDVVAKGAGGRIGLWPYSYTNYVASALTHLAMEMIEGKATGNTLNDIENAFKALAPGCDWKAGVFTYPDGRKLDNYYLLSMDTYILGKGYSGVLSKPFPEKYFSIDAEDPQ
ncbi:MAG: DUF3798 domain-containing protein [Clostridiales bacterium]|nr:DUF3798 domain-containing protein [Clostridiales bacterium]